MLEGFQNAFRIPELKRRILFTIALLCVYRLGGHVPTPGVNSEALVSAFASQANSLFGLYDLFVGGSFAKATVFALGIMPYISASIILQLLGAVIPYFEKLQKEGEEGRKKITQYTRLGTVGLAAVQSIAFSKFLESLGAQGTPVVPHPGPAFELMTMITQTAGTILIMWLGEQITERGIGNGISLIIFAGIVARFPDALVQLVQKSSTQGDLTAFDLAVILFIVVAVIAVIIFFEQGQRRIPVQYAKRVVGRKMYGGQSTHLPLKINVAGVIPPIFASSILMFPAQLAGFVGSSWMQKVSDVLQPGDWRYNVMYIGLIVFFCYFYTAVTFNPVDVADNMKKYGGFIPGIRPGKATAEYIDKVLTRLTFGGALYIAAVCILPSFMQQRWHVPFSFGGTGLLIVVGVALDTVQQIESHLITRNYEGFTGPKGPRIRGRVAMRSRA